jgi:hypothetical protein
LQGIDFKSYDNINFVLSNDLDCCAWGGGYFSAVDAKSYGATWEPPWGQEAGTYVHEMGHSLGLPHSGWVYHAYDSPWDMMSARMSARSVPCGSYASRNSGTTSNLSCSEPGDGYIAAHKDYLGWMPLANQVETNTSFNPNLTVTLEADALPLGSSTKMIKICLTGLPCSGSAAHYFTVEARVGGVGVISQYDNGLPGNGVIIHEFQGDRPPVSGSCFFNSQSGWAWPIDTTPNDYDSVNCQTVGAYPEYALFNAQLNPGEIYTNNTYGFSVAVLSQAASTFVVAVNASTYTITLAASPSAGGTVSGAGAYAAGSSRTVTATANSGYAFANWTENGSVVSTTASYTFSLNANRNLIANFSATPGAYTITLGASPSAGGTVGGGGTFAAGSSRTVTATANGGYTFANWTESGAVVSSTASYTFTLNANRNLIANFSVAPTSYTITLAASPSAGGTVGGAGTFAAGTSRTVTATANGGYAFSSWTENGAVVSTAASYSFRLDANRSLVAGFTPTRLTTNDFNGDGKADVLFRNGDGTLAMVLMDGARALSVNQMAGKPTNWSVAGVGDFNNDRKADIFWRNTDGSVEIWLMNGAAIMSTASVGVKPTSWAMAGTGDFNGDGRADILWRNTDGSVEIWLMNGAAITSTASVGVKPTSWTIAGTGDFNGDGKADILWRNSDGSVEIWLMNGAAITSTAVLGVVPLSWNVARVGDFDGDGKADTLWRNADGSIGIVLMNGASITSSAVIGVVPLSWSAVGTGDFNGDGKSDILWRNTDGSVAMLLMNGTSVASSAGLGVVPTIWTVVP